VQQIRTDDFWIEGKSFSNERKYKGATKRPRVPSFLGQLKKVVSTLLTGEKIVGIWRDGNRFILKPRVAFLRKGSRWKFKNTNWSTTGGGVLRTWGKLQEGREEKRVHELVGTFRKKKINSGKDSSK